MEDGRRTGRETGPASSRGDRQPLVQRAVHEKEAAEGERKLLLLQADAALPVPDATTQVTQLQQQIDILARERDALRATPVPGASPQDKNGKWSAENIPAMPTDLQDWTGWIIDRNCELWNAREVGDADLVAKIGGLIGEGATQLGLLGRDRDVPMDGQSRSALMSGLNED